MKTYFHVSPIVGRLPKWINTSISKHQSCYNYCCIKKTIWEPLFNNSDRSQPHPGQIIKEIYKVFPMPASPRIRRAVEWQNRILKNTWLISVYKRDLERQSLHAVLINMSSTVNRKALPHTIAQYNTSRCSLGSHSQDTPIFKHTLNAIKKTHLKYIKAFHSEIWESNPYEPCHSYNLCESSAEKFIPSASLGQC